MNESDGFVVLKVFRVRVDDIVHEHAVDASLAASARQRLDGGEYVVAHVSNSIADDAEALLNWLARGD